MLFTADFETTTVPEDCRVWAAGVSSIDDRHNFYYGNSIDWFMDFVIANPGATFYFHNEKFDGEFILIWLFEHGYGHVKDRILKTPFTFSTLISDAGQFYSIKICFKKFDNICTCTILDSLKILPFSVSDIAKGFGLQLSKLTIDYTDFREIGHKLTENEIEYLKTDVEIMSRSLKILFDQGLTQMTQGSNALFDYKNVIGKKKFLKWFPPPLYDYDIRQSYKGGFTYCDPRTQCKDTEEGIVLDVNSLYPSVMYNEPMPYGEGIFFEGKYEEDKLYNLYVQMFTCQFELKENHIPTIQIKNNCSFHPTQYLKSSAEEEVTLCLTNVDLELFFEHYDVFNITYHNGWKFKSTTGLFKGYIDKWNTIKVESTLSENYAMRTLAKLMLNALYGKFALNPFVTSKYPVYDNGMIRYKTGEKEQRNPIYIPVGTFVTSYARRKTIRAAQTVYSRFMYADTDSLHLSGTKLPEELDIDPVRLGAWKHESTFTRARYVRQKTYVEEIIINEKTRTKMIKNGTSKNMFYYSKGELVFLNITCAGMSSRCYEHVTWDNFVKGSSFDGKLQFTHVKGGIVLKDIQFTIKE